jgi:hypothetical protein
LVVFALAAIAAPLAGANVRAFSARTGAEDKAFVKFGSQTRPSALIADDRHGLYVVGGLTVNGRTLKIVHVLPDGTIDPSFHLSIGPGMVFSGAVRGNRADRRNSPRTASKNRRLHKR